MKIAVTSQNFRTITGHGGRARRYLIYAPDANGRAVEADRLDLPLELAFHEFHGNGPHPVDEMDLLITGSCGGGFVHRLATRGVKVLTTGERDPLAAAQAALEGRPLPPAAPDEHDHGHQPHHHGDH